MEKKHQVHNLIILDENSSMGFIKTIIIQGFNELAPQTIRAFVKLRRIKRQRIGRRILITENNFKEFSHASN
jgi:hypothetical protein